jgi:hypothetical protein
VSVESSPATPFSASLESSRPPEAHSSKPGETIMSKKPLGLVHRTATGIFFVLIVAIIAQFTISPIGVTALSQELPIAVTTVNQLPLIAMPPGIQDPPKPVVEVILPDGTEFTVVTTEEISSKTATEGDLLTFKVAEDVVINGHVLIAKNALVKGVVSSAKKAGMMGRGGNLAIRIESTTAVDNQKTKLRSSKGTEGSDKTGTTVALVVIFGPLGFLKHGKNATIKTGTLIKVYTDEAKNIQVKT